MSDIKKNQGSVTSLESLKCPIMCHFKKTPYCMWTLEQVWVLRRFAGVFTKEPKHCFFRRTEQEDDFQDLAPEVIDTTVQITIRIARN